MKKMTKEAQMQTNGGAKVRAICFTCYMEGGNNVVFACTKSALTVKGAKRAALKQLSAHSDEKLHGHNVGYVVY